MTNLDRILKSRDITLPTRVLLVKAMFFFFPLVEYGCESWTIKKTECQRIDASELWCWRRLLRALWTERRSNQSILKEISPEYSLEGLMLKLKLQYFGTWCEELTYWKRLWCCERLKAGGKGEDRGWDGWMASPTQWTWAWVRSGSWWWTGKPGALQSSGLQRVGHDWVTELNRPHDGLDVLGPLKITCFCLDLVTHLIFPFLTVWWAFSVTCHWCLNSTMLMRTISTAL